MGFGDQHYSLQIKDLRTGEPITSGCYVFIHTLGTKTLPTIYKNDARGTLANPITRAQFALDAGISFFTLAPSVDITVCDEKGNVSKVFGITPNDRTITLNRDGVDKCLVAPFIFNNNVETDTGLDFPENSWITGSVVEVVTVEASKTINVGLLSSETGGSATGIVSAKSVATAGSLPTVGAPGPVAVDGAAVSLAYTCSASSVAQAGYLYVFFRTLR